MKNLKLLFSFGALFFVSSVSAHGFVNQSTEKNYARNKYFSADRMYQRSTTQLRPNYYQGKFASVETTPVYIGQYYEPIYQNDEIYVSSHYRSPKVYKRMYYINNPNTHKNAYPYVYGNQKRAWYTHPHPYGYYIEY